MATISPTTLRKLGLNTTDLTPEQLSTLARAIHNLGPSGRAAGASGAPHAAPTVPQRAVKTTITYKQINITCSTCSSSWTKHEPIKVSTYGVAARAPSVPQAARTCIDTTAPTPIPISETRHTCRHCAPSASASGVTYQDLVTIALSSPTTRAMLHERIISRRTDPLASTRQLSSGHTDTALSNPLEAEGCLDRTINLQITRTRNTLQPVANYVTSTPLPFRA